MPNDRFVLLARSLVGVALLTPAAGVAASTVPPSTATTVPDADRTVSTIWGDVAPPRDPEVIVALDEYAGLGMPRLGQQPDLVLAPYNATIAAGLLEAAGVEVEPIVYGEWNLERVAELEPDVIVVVGGQETSAFYDSMSEIAPTVVLPYIADWRDVAAAYGDVADAMTGKSGSGAAITTAIEARIAEVGADVPAGATVSVLTSGSAFGTYSIGDDVSTSLLLAELGYTRPTIEQRPGTNGSIVATDAELLVEHDADTVVGLGGDEAFFSVEALQALPTFEQIPAVADGRWVEALGAMWTSSDPFSMWWVLDDVEAMLAGTPLGTDADAETRWETYLTAIS